jgi:hypothetical protein
MLTRKILDEEYNYWTSKYGTGRNDQRWRFGQYLSNTYTIYSKNYDPFFEENADVVYIKLRQILTDLEEMHNSYE